MHTQSITLDVADNMQVPASPMRHPLRWLGAIVFALIVVAPILPSAPVFPSGGLDPSWMLALNYAVAHHLQFGRQIISTFGPYASLYTHSYSPETATLMLVGSICLAAIYFFSLLFIFNTHPSRATLVKLALLAVVVLVSQVSIGSIFLNSIFTIYPAVAVIAIGRSSADASQLDNSLATVRRTASAIAICVPLGIIPIVKLSFAIPSAFASVAILVILLHNKNYITSISCVTVTIASCLIAWLLSGQPIDALVPFVSRSTWIISGYTGAMSMPGETRDWFYLAFEIICVAAILFRIGTGSIDKVVMSLTLCFVMFLLFKEGIVRHDAHVLIPLSGFALVAVISGFMVDDHWPVVPLAVASVICAIVGASNYVPFSLLKTGEGVATGLTATSQVISRLLNDGHRSAYKYSMALKAIRMESPLPVLRGTSDIYPVDVAALLASGNQWNPRPAFQSYFAYTRQLAALNATHLTAPGAPRNVFFAISPIDNRLPALEDGPSWPELLAGYWPLDMSGGYAVLQQRLKGARPPALVDIGSGAGQLGAAVYVGAHPDSLVFAAFDIKPSLLGRMLSLAFKPPDLQVALRLSDGSVKHYRLIASMAASPFLLSPAVSSTEQFVLLYGAPALSAGRAVRSFTVEVTGGGLRAAWQRAYSFQLFTLNYARGMPAAQIAKLTGIESFEPSANLQRSPTDAQCSLDAINGQPAQDMAPILAGSTVTFGGWIGDGHGHAIGRGLLVLQGKTRSYSIPFITGIPRPDVATALRSEQMATSGFQVTGALAGVLRGSYTVFMTDVGQQTTLCEAKARVDVQ